MKQLITKTFIAGIMMFVSLSGFAQVKALEKFSDTDGVTYVYISKVMLRMAGHVAAPSVPGIDMKGISNKLECLQIITSEQKSASAKLRTDFKSITMVGKYDLLMQVDDEGTKVRIYFKDGKGKAQSVIAMLTEEANETTLICFCGTFVQTDIEQMVNNVKK